MKKILIIFSLSFGLLLGVNVKKAYFKSYNYEKMGNYNDAIKVLVPIYQKNPNSYYINLRLGWLFFLNKNYKNAISHYKKALILKPNSAEANLGLLRSYLNSNKLDIAIRVANAVLKKDLYNFYGNYYLVLALKQKNNLSEALKITNKMLALYPSSVIFLEQLASILSTIEPKEAKKIYQYILIIDPNNVSAKTYLDKNRYFLKVY